MAIDDIVFISIIRTVQTIKKCATYTLENTGIFKCTSAVKSWTSVLIAPPAGEEGGYRLALAL